MIENLCLALLTAGSIPPGALPLIIETEQLQVFVYSEEDKRMVTRLLCQYRELSDLEKPE